VNRAGLRRFLISVGIAVVAVALAGCRPGSISSQAEAVAKARAISGLAEPITIVKVVHGPAGEIFDGVPASGVGDQAAEKARLRPAWMVKMQGFAKGACADAPAPLPCGLVIREMVLAEDNGELIVTLTIPG